MRYRVYMLRVKFKGRKAIAVDFSTLRAALEAAWGLSDSPIVDYINLKTDWRETPEWLKEICRDG